MCTSPNLMRFVGKNEEGKEQFEFLGSSKNFDFLFRQGLHDDIVQVPCGCCDECLAERSRHWAERCALEAKKSKNNYFVTLTYNDDQVPQEGVSTKALSNFMRKLRKFFPGVKIRFFGCGEYGGKTFRPHYHVILFNCPLDDLSEVFLEEKNGRLVAHRIGELDYRCLYSDKIHQAWDRKGNISVALFSFATACYVAQYVTKKSTRDLKKFYKMFSCNREFVQMSRRPGIGGDSLDDADYTNDCIICPGDGKAHVTCIPRYFDKLIIKQKGEEWFNEHVRSQRNEKKRIRYEGYKAEYHRFGEEWWKKANRLKRRRKERQSL